MNFLEKDPGYSFSGENDVITMCDSMSSEQENNEETISTDDDPGIENDDAFYEGLSDSDTEKEVSISQGSTDTAHFFVKSFDHMTSFLMSRYAKAETSDPFKASDGDLKEVSQYLSSYISEKSAELPPWVMALVAYGFVMVAKFDVASSVRDSNIKRIAAEKETEQLKLQLQKLEHREKVVDLERKVRDKEQELNAETEVIESENIPTVDE